MGLTEQQRLYGLSDYFLLLTIGDNDICGLISKENANKINKNELLKLGFYIKKIDFDELYSQGLTILRDEQLI